MKTDSGGSVGVPKRGSMMTLHSSVMTSSSSVMTLSGSEMTADGWWLWDHGSLNKDRVRW